MAKLQIAICDDDALHLRHTASLVSGAYPPSQAEINTFSSGELLLKCISPDGYCPDIAILDIRMEQLDGISLAMELNRLAPGCGVIFLTGYPEYAPEAYLTRHVWFIPKDRAGEFLVPALQRAVSGLAPYSRESTMLIRRQGQAVLVPFRDVMYIDRVGRKTRVVCREEEYLVTQRPETLISPALAPYMIRCHQGYWVNFIHIRSIDHNDFILDDDTRLPISRTFRDPARERFFALYGDTT